MDQNGQLNLARHYCVDDLPGAKQAGARLNGILLKIDAADQLSAASMRFLADSGLHALCAFSPKSIPMTKILPSAFVI